MNRVFLLGAMAISLWPAVFLGVSWTSTDTTETASSEADVAANNDDDYDPYEDPPSADVGQEEDFDAPPEKPQPDCAGLERILRRSSRLNERFDKVELTAGVPIPDIASEATTLAERYRRWLIDNRRTFREVRQFVRRERDVLSAMAAVANSPSQQGLDAYNRAVRTFNARSDDIQGYC